METIRKSLQAINITSPDGDDEEERSQQKHEPLRAGDRVLLTGANGFIGGHILKALLEAGLNVKAVVNTRNEEMMVKRLSGENEGQVHITIAGVVGDKSAEVMSDVLGVIITACPHQNWDQRQESNIVGILDTICKHNSMIRRVILTSVMNDLNKDRESSDWDPTAAGALKISPPKTPIERAAWKYISAHSPNFNLASVIVPTLFGPSAHDPPTTEPVSEILRFIRGPSGSIPINTMGPWADVRDVSKAHVAALMKGGISGDAGEDRFFAVAGMYSSKQICKIVGKWFPQLITEGRTPRADSVPGAFEQLEEDEMAGGKYEGDNSVTDELGVAMRGLEESVVDTVEGLLKFEEMVKGHGKGVPLEAMKTRDMPVEGHAASSFHSGGCRCGDCASKIRHRRTSVDEELEERQGLRKNRDNLYTLVEQAYEGSASSRQLSASNIPRSLMRDEVICVCTPGEQCTCSGLVTVQDRPMRKVSIVLNKPDTGEMLHSHV